MTKFLFYCFLFCFLFHFCISEIPIGTSFFFKTDKCPLNWKENTSTQGRVLLSTNDGANAGGSVGSPLNDQEDIMHQHTYSTTFNLPSKQISADSCCNPTGACAQVYDISGTSSSETSGVSFIQLLFCEYQGGSNIDYYTNYGTVTYFGSDVRECPISWDQVEQAQGRVMIPGSINATYVSDAPGIVDLRDITHNHTFSDVVDIAPTQYIGLGDCCNDDLGASNSYNITGVTDESSTGIPYINVLTCQYSNESAVNVTLPKDVVLFNLNGCPSGFSYASAIAGRFPVSLPPNGLANAPFGGNPMPVNYTGPSGIHDHSFKSNFDLTTCEIGLATGCCAGGYATETTDINYSGLTEPSAVEFPYFVVPACIQN